MARTILKLGSTLKDKNQQVLSIGDDIVMVARGGGLYRGLITRETDASIFIKDKWMLKNNCHWECIKL